jgi:NTE family protein
MRVESEVALVPNDAAGGQVPRVAFVLGGGGIHGAVQVGMLRALTERQIAPDVVIGTSVGAMNGAMLAAVPDDAIERLCTLWADIDEWSPFDASLLERATTFARTRTHLHSNTRLRRLLLGALPARDFDDLAIPFMCVAASIERAAAHWFTRGSLIDALLATTAVPGLLPPVEIDGEHFLDGGLVDSIPVDRAIEEGATDIYVLQVGRVEQPLAPPRRPWEVGLVAFEIARRHRFSEAVARAPAGVDIHLLPSGADDEVDYTDPSSLRYRDTSRIRERIEAAYQAASAHLDSPVDSSLRAAD